ncbi:hypothetical protein ACJX0J_041031, partial [Zea mays]
AEQGGTLGTILNAPIHILILKTNSTVVIWKLSQVMRRYMHKMKEICLAFTTQEICST